MDLLSPFLAGAFLGVCLWWWWRAVISFVTLPEVPWKPVPWGAISLGTVLLIVGLVSITGGEVAFFSGILPPGPKPSEWLDRVVAQQQVGQALALGIGPVAGVEHARQSEMEAAARLHQAQQIPIGLAVDTLSKVLLLFIVVGFLRWSCGATWSDLGWHPQRWRTDMAEGFTGFVAVVPPVLFVMVLLKTSAPEEVREHELITLMRSNPQPLVWLLCGLAVVVVAPLFEELLFRRILQGWLERLEYRLQPTGFLRGLPGWGPIVFTSALFGFFHAAWPDPLPLMLLAMGLGYLMRRTQSLLPSIVLHACLNGLTFLELILMALVGE